MNRRQSALTMTVFVLVLSLLLAACGPATPAAAPEAAVAEPTEAMASSGEMEKTDEMASLPTIAEIAAGDANFSTLVSALQAADLVTVLSDKSGGPYTVFAPTNAAFAALPAGELEKLLADPAGTLKNVLTYHVVNGAVKAETVVTLNAATTLNGEDVAIAVMDGGVVLNDSAQVVTTDIEASNGVIHVIDAVLLPPSMAMMDAPGTIAEIAAGNPEFSTLVTALSAAGLVETLADAAGGPYTVFAPTNAAFAALPAGELDKLLADPMGALKNVLTYHVISGAVKAEDVVTLTSADALNGEPIAIAVMDGGVTLNEAAKVITTDIAASNGVIHVIDAVLLPPSLSMMDDTMADKGTIADIAVGNPDFSTLVTALSAAGLVDTLADPTGGPYTVFAPTNAAFAALPAGLLDTLLADPAGALTNILLYHVVGQAVKAETVVTLDEAMTLLGQPVTITVEDGAVILNGVAKVVATDIEASNGVVHVIDAVLVPAE